MGPILYMYVRRVCNIKRIENRNYTDFIWIYVVWFKILFLYNSKLSRKETIKYWIIQIATVNPFVPKRIRKN